LEESEFAEIFKRILELEENIENFIYIVPPEVYNSLPVKSENILCSSKVKDMGIKIPKDKFY